MVRWAEKMFIKVVPRFCSWHSMASRCSYGISGVRTIVGVSSLFGRRSARDRGILCLRDWSSW